VGSVVRLTELVDRYLRGAEALGLSSPLNFICSTNGKRALGSDVRGTQSILHVVYFAAHRLICSLVCWQVLVEDVEFLGLSYRYYIRRFLTVS